MIWPPFHCDPFETSWEVEESPKTKLIKHDKMIKPDITDGVTTLKTATRYYICDIRI